MNKHTHFSQQGTNPFTKTFLIFIMLSILLSSCGAVIQAPVPTQPNTESTQSEQAPTTQALTSIPETEVATETVPSSLIKIDMDNVIYPPLSNVQENFKKGEYDSGLETIKQWVGVWEKMGVFEEIIIENDSLSPVPLDGRARVVCVDTRKKGEYSGTMLCPPLDLINGGLKAVPEEGKWDETDKPLHFKFEEFEELVTKGNRNELVYQFMDKYMDTYTRYFDSKTGQIVEGNSLVSDVEVVENEVIKGSVVCVSKEYCMNGQMEVDQEVAKIFYERFINALIHTEENKDYFYNLLNGDVSSMALKSYLEINNGIVPPGLRMISNAGRGYLRMRAVLDKSVNLSALKTIVFGSKEWEDNISYIQEYLLECEKIGISDPFAATVYPSFMYFGWFVDLSGYIVIVNGSKFPEPDQPFEEPYLAIGGKDGAYIPERDNKVATGYALSLVTFMERLGDIEIGGVLPLDSVGGNMGAYKKDVEEFAEGKFLFKADD